MEKISIGSYNNALTNAKLHYKNPSATAGEPIAEKIAGGYKVRVPLEGVEYDSRIIAVTFDSGAMTGTAFETISSGDTEKNITVKTETADTVKVFIWDSLNSMTPLCEPKTITIE